MYSNTRSNTSSSLHLNRYDTVCMLKAAADEAQENHSISNFHVPGFWKVPENWNKILDVSSNSRSDRTRESKRGGAENGLEEPFKRLYLKAKSSEKSDRARRKAVRVNEAKYGDYDDNQID
jgi:hypothetical protein